MCAPVVEFAPKIASARARLESALRILVHDLSFLAQAAVMTLPLVASMSHGIADNNCKLLKQQGNGLQQSDMESGWAGNAK